MDTPTTVLDNGTSVSIPGQDTSVVQPFQIPPQFHAFIAIHFLGGRRKQVSITSPQQPGLNPVVQSCSDGMKFCLVIPNYSTVMSMDVNLNVEIDTAYCMQPLGTMKPAKFDGWRSTLPIGTSSSLYYAFSGNEPAEIEEKIGIVIILQEGVELNQTKSDT